MQNINSQNSKTINNSICKTVAGVCQSCAFNTVKMIWGTNLNQSNEINWNKPNWHTELHRFKTKPVNKIVIEFKNGIFRFECSTICTTGQTTWQQLIQIRLVHAKNFNEFHGKTNVPQKVSPKRSMELMFKIMHGFIE